MTREELEDKQARLRIQLMDLELLDTWTDVEKEEYLKLKVEYFKVLNQLNEKAM